MDLENGLATRTLEGHTGIVRSLALAPDGSTLTSGGDDGVVRVWALDTGKTRLELRGHGGAVEAVVIAQNGKRAISGSRDRTLYVWDLETGEALQILQGHSGFVRAIAISSPRGRVVSGSTDKTIRYWNISSGSVDRSVDGHADAVSRLAISSSGDCALSGSGGSDLLVWGADEKGALRVTGRLEGHTDRIHAIRLTASGDVAVTGSRDRTLRIWDVKRRTTTHVLKGHAREVLDLQISADGRRVVSLSRDRTVRVWDIQTGRAIRALVSQDNERALASLSAGNAIIAELETGPILDVSARPIPRDPTVALSPEGNYVVLGSQGNACVWNLETGATRDQELGDLDIVAIEFGPERIVLGSLFGPLLFWQFEADPRLVEGHSGRILDIVVTPDGRSVVSAASDDSIRIWDFDSSRQKRQLQGCVGRADAVAIAPYGTRAFSIYGHTLVAYDLTAGARVGSLSFDHQITTLSLSGTGTRLAIGDLSGRVHFVELSS